jgi:hypothetical protein
MTSKVAESFSRLLAEFFGRLESTVLVVTSAVVDFAVVVVSVVVPGVVVVVVVVPR